jgi:hypothetical protein
VSGAAYVLRHRNDERDDKRVTIRVDYMDGFFLRLEFTVVAVSVFA